MSDGTGGTGSTGGDHSAATLAQTHGMGRIQSPTLLISNDAQLPMPGEQPISAEAAKESATGSTGAEKPTKPDEAAADVEGSDDHLPIPQRLEDLWANPVIRLAYLRAIVFQGTVWSWFVVLFLSMFLQTQEWFITYFWVWPVTMGALTWLERRLTLGHAEALLRQRQSSPPALRCVSCNYALVNLTFPRCPECGRPFRLNDKPYVTRAERLDWGSLVRTMTLSMLLSTSLLAFGLFSYNRFGWGWLYTVMGGVGYVLVILWVYLVGRQRMALYRIPPPAFFPCPACQTELPTPVPDSCTRCQHDMHCEDVFVRCSPWNTMDQRYRELSRQALIGQVITLGGIGTSLACYLLLTRFQQWLPAAFQWPIGLTTLGLVGATVTFMMIRRIGGREWGQRARLLFTQAVPSCRRCDQDLSHLPVRGNCPKCHLAYDPRHLHG